MRADARAGILVALSCACVAPVAAGSPCTTMRGKLAQQGAMVSGLGGGLAGGGAVVLATTFYENSQLPEDVEASRVHYVISGIAILGGLIALNVGGVQAYRAGDMECREPTPSGPVVARPALRSAPASAPTIDPCAACVESCPSERAACNEGNVASCYAAAACRCRCRIEAGGCGDNPEQLAECASRQPTKP